MAQDCSQVSEIQRAVEESDFGRIDALISNTVSAQEKCDLLAEALSTACEKELLPVVEHLLKAGADSTKKFDDRQTPLQSAVISDNVGILKALLGSGDRNGNREAWSRALRAAFVDAKSEEVIDLLIKNDADIYSTGEDGSTILMEARTETVIRYLISKGLPPEARDNDGRTALRRTVQLDEDSVKAQLLIEMGDADIEAQDNSGRSVLMTAVWKSRTAVLKLLIEKSVKVNAVDDRGRTVLHHLALVQERKYDYRPNLGSDGNAGQQETDRQMLEDLVTANVHLERKDNKGRTCIHCAAEIGCGGLLMNLLQLLLRHCQGFNVDEPQPDGKTPLHLAAANGNTNCLAMLLSKDAHIDRRQPDGKTPVHLAAANGNADCLDMLLKNGANAHAEDDGDWTPLHFACEANGDVLDCVNKLLDKEANANKKTRTGLTPLHIAAGAGNPKIVRRLLEHPRIKRNARDMFGNTALFSAACSKRSNRAEVLKLFTPSNDFITLSEEEKTAAQQWHARIVDFPGTQVSSSENNERSSDRSDRVGESKTVYDLLYERDSSDPTDPNRSAHTVAPSNVGEGGFRWIHLPANNVAWCQDLFSKYYIEDNTMKVNSFKALERSFNQQRGGSLPQSRYMTSTCMSVVRSWGDEEGGNTIEGGPKRSDTHNSDMELYSPDAERQTASGAAKDFATGRSSAEPQEQPKSPTLQSANQVKLSEEASISDFYVFMPYLHFETVREQQEMFKYYHEFEKDHEPGKNLEGLNSDPASDVSNESDIALFRAYLNTEDHSLHIRRTLDQSFYHYINTKKRDTDQVIDRFQRKILGYERDKRKVLMVDQLWMWIIGKNLVVTCFPQRWRQPKKDPFNLLDYVLSIIALGNRHPVRNVLELAMIISGRCYGAYDRHGVGSEDHFLDMFEGWIGNAMDDETKVFEFFKRDSNKASEWLRNPRSLREIKRFHNRQNGKKPKTLREYDFKVLTRDPDEHPAKEEDFVENLLDIGWETTLLEEIKDIRDELDMLLLIFERQENVLEGVWNSIQAICKQNKPLTAELNQFSRAYEDQKRTITQPERDIKRMRDQAMAMYASVNDLLGLKQTHANAIEARYAREQTDDSSKQGKTLTVFTTVTTIFLPLSFIAALFAIEIPELPHDKNGNQALPMGFVSTYTFGVGLVIALICVGLAIKAEDIWDEIRIFFGWDKEKTEHPEEKAEKRSSIDERQRSRDSARPLSQAPGRSPQARSINAPAADASDTSSSVICPPCRWRSRKDRKDLESGTSRSRSRSTAMNGSIEK